MLLTKGEDGEGGIYRDSCYRHDADTSKVIYLDLYEDHVSLILNIDGYSGVKQFICVLNAVDNLVKWVRLTTTSGLCFN